MSTSPHPLPKLPRRAYRYGYPGTLGLMQWSPRQIWIIQQSIMRWERNHNAGHKMELPLMEVGRVDGMRVMATDPSPGMQGSITAFGLHAEVSPLRFAQPGDDSFGFVYID